MLEHKSKIVGLTLLCVAFSSAALTLGRVRGAVLIGQPLELVVQVQLEAGEDASSQCFDADVFHADTRQDASRVRVAVEPVAQSPKVNLRISSSAIVDEPVVTVYVRGGCSQKSTRRYVLLADLASEVAPAAAPLVAAAAAPSAAQPAVTAAVPEAAAASAPAAAPVAPAVSSAKVKKPAASKPAAGREAGSKRAKAKAAPAAAKSPLPVKEGKTGRAGGQSRLKLEHLELFSDRIANLDSVVSFAPSEDALLNMKKLQTLEADVKALRDSASKGERSLVDLKARLQKAEAERFSSPVVYGLLALVMACLAALAWLWNRQRHAASAGAEWWDDASVMPPSVARESGLESRAGAAAVSSRPGPVSVARESQPFNAADEVGRLFDTDAVQHPSEPAFPKLAQPSVFDAENLDQPATAPGQARLVRSLNSETILDLRHQAEFFVTLGKTDEAVKLLKQQISESDEPNPFVYLDLLEIFHSLGMKNDFQQYCQDFNLLFNGRVPEYAFFKDEGQGLESYPDVLNRIAGLWPTAKALEVIEACIFRDPWAELSQPFDLAALRDLLLLHSIAQSIVLAPAADSAVPMADSAAAYAARASAHDRAGFDFEDSVSSTFPALSKSALADLFAREAPPAPSRVLDLDLDLSDLEETAAGHLAPSADIDLSLLIPGSHEPGGRSGRGSPLPDAAAPARADGQKPGPLFGLG